jgi:hypothetical protein
MFLKAASIWRHGGVNTPLTMTVLNDGALANGEAARREWIMSTIIKFPADAAARRLGVNVAPSPRETSAEILILPVIRIERQIDDSNGGSGPEEGTAPGRRRKRRARS